MPKEIERKFLVDPAKLPPLTSPHVIRQGYVQGCQTATVRLRISNNKAFLTLKGKATGISRSEFEYPVPLDDAQAMLDELCTQAVIEKKRYLIFHENHTWEVDVFEGKNAGLIVAEIELSEEEEEFVKPAWVTKEVSHETKYRNSNLVSRPYALWNENRHSPFHS